MLIICHTKRCLSKIVTKPVRPVFDASAKEGKSLPLNDCLEKGPNLLEIITSVVIKIGMWRGTNEKFRRVVFGMTRTTSLPAATINHILDKAAIEYEDTVSKLRNANYVDNGVTSLEAEESVIKFKDESVKILKLNSIYVAGNGIPQRTFKTRISQYSA